MDLPTSGDSKQKPLGLGAQVAVLLTKAILEGDFRGGEQLVEQELQSRYSVSRSPLREAFRELEKKGLVDIVPRRGTFVKRITFKDIQNHFPVRAVLEGLAARLATRAMTDQHRQELAAVLERMKDAVAHQDTGAYYQHHLHFHEIFIAASGNDLLIDTLQTLRMQNLWHRFSYRYYQENLENSYGVHQRIYELFSAAEPDGDTIRTVVEEHIAVAMERFLVYLSRHEHHDPVRSSQ